MSVEISTIIFIGLVSAACGFRLHGPSGPLVAQLGGSVLLPCFVDTPLPLGDLEVEWRRTDSDALVHLFQEGEVRPESQDHAYSGRAHFSLNNIAEGNFSLPLENITLSDKGLYRCVVYTDQKSREISCEIKNVDYLVVHGVDHASFAYVGQEVVLDCSVDSHIPPESLDEVKWTKTDQEILVLLFQHGEVLPDSSHEQYRGRAEFFTSEIPKGNFSLRLKDVRTEDKGEYICEAHSGHLLGNTAVVLPSLGLSTLHQLILVLCLFAFGFSIASLLHFIKTDGDGRALLVHFSLIISPNILLSIAFIMWSFTEGFVDEAATCSTVNLARIIFLLLTTPYLDKFPKYLLNTIKSLSILMQYSAIAIVVYSVAFSNRRNINLLSVSQTATRELSTYFVLIPVSCAGGIIAVTTQTVCPSIFCIDGSKTKTRPKEIWSFIFMEICNLCQFLFISLKTRSLESAVKVVFLLCVLMQPILLILIRKLRKRLRHGNVCWTVTVSVLVPLYIVSSLYYTSQVQDFVEKLFPFEYGGIMVVTALLRILSALSLLEPPCQIKGRRPHLAVYGFGTVGVSVVNSIALMAELIFKARNGQRSISDLRLVTLPFESVFVSGWFILLIYSYWVCSRGRGEACEIHQKPVKQDTPPVDEMETIFPNGSHSQ